MKLKDSYYGKYLNIYLKNLYSTLDAWIGQTMPTVTAVPYNMLDIIIKFKLVRQTLRNLVMNIPWVFYQ